VYELKEELKDELEQYSSRSPVSRPSPIITTSTGRGSAFTLLRRAMDYLRSVFPLVLPNIQHVVINSIAGSEFATRTGKSWTLIPNIMDFKILPQGIETSIELVSRLNRPKSPLIIPHKAGDEGFSYRQRVEERTRFMGVDLRLISDRIAKDRSVDKEGKKRYPL